MFGDLHPFPGMWINRSIVCFVRNLHFCCSRLGGFHPKFPHSPIHRHPQPPTFSGRISVCPPRSAWPCASSGRQCSCSSLCSTPLLLLCGLLLRPLRSLAPFPRSSTGLPPGRLWSAILCGNIYPPWPCFSSTCSSRISSNVCEICSSLSLSSPPFLVLDCRTPPHAVDSTVLVEMACSWLVCVIVITYICVGFVWPLMCFL